ncbi:MAG TPA: hypothetical protein VGE80_10415, partial [Schlesneria sp.]
MDVRSLGCLFVLLTASAGWSENFVPLQKYEAADGLNAGDETSEDARQCLVDLSWKPVRFEVTVQPNEHPLDPSIVRFPSPRPSGIEVNDLVALEWYSAKNEKNEVIEAPAVIVVHESG